MTYARRLMRGMQQILFVVLLATGLLAGAAPAAAAERELTVDEFSVVKVTVKAVPNARSTKIGRAHV